MIKVQQKQDVNPGFASLSDCISPKVFDTNTAFVSVPSWYCTHLAWDELLIQGEQTRIRNDRHPLAQTGIVCSFFYPNTVWNVILYELLYHTKNDPWLFCSLCDIIITIIDYYTSHVVNFSCIVDMAEDRHSENRARVDWSGEGVFG